MQTASIWTLASSNAPWGLRTSSSCAVLNNKLLLIGGWSGSIVGTSSTITYFNDVWASSTLGDSWTLLTHAASFSPRRGHSCLVHNNLIFLFAGVDPGYKNDVFLTSDGITWNAQTTSAPWSPRFLTAVATVGNNIVLVGGLQQAGSTGDIWISNNNGANWGLQSNGALFGTRYGHALVGYQNNIYLCGGVNNITFIDVGNDMYSSNDQGATWIVVNSNTKWPGRYAHSVVVLNGVFILFGGNNGVSSFPYLNDMYYSSDLGNSWSLQTNNTNWSPRQFMASQVVNNSTIIMIAGDAGTDTTWNLNKDVWSLTFSGTYFSNGVYYPCSSPQQGYYVQVPCSSLANTVIVACSIPQLGYFASQLCVGGSYSFQGSDSISSLCPAGSYCANGVAVPCPAGTFSVLTGSVSETSCNVCSAGSSSIAGQSRCTFCQVGYFSAAGEGSCAKCDSGTTSIVGSSSCIPAQTTLSFALTIFGYITATLSLITIIYKLFMVRKYAVTNKIKGGLGLFAFISIFSLGSNSDYIIKDKKNSVAEINVNIHNNILSTTNNSTAAGSRNSLNPLLMSGNLQNNIENKNNNSNAFSTIDEEAGGKNKSWSKSNTKNLPPPPPSSIQLQSLSPKDNAIKNIDKNNIGSISPKNKIHSPPPVPQKSFKK